jgi:hypothetical protein
MPDANDTRSPENRPIEGWWQRRFGDKGFVQILCGEDVPALLAVILVATLCVLLLVKERYDMQGSFMYVLLLVVAFQFLKLPQRGK